MVSYGQCALLLALVAPLHYLGSLGLEQIYAIGDEPEFVKQSGRANGLITSLLASLIATGFASLTFALVIHLYFQKFEIPHSFLFIILLTTHNVFGASGAIVSATLRRNKHLVLGALRDQLLFPILLLVFFYFFVTGQQAIINIALAYFAAALLSSLLILFIARDLLLELRGPLNLRANIKQVLIKTKKYGMPIALANALESGLVCLPLIAAGVFCNPESVGFLSVAYRLAALVQLPGIAISPISLVYLSRNERFSHAFGALRRNHRMFSLIVGIVAVIGILSLSQALAIHFNVPLVYDRLFFWSLAGCTFAALVDSSYSDQKLALVTIKSGKAYLACSLFGIVCSFFLCLSLSYGFGVIGAAFSLLASSLCTAIMRAQFLRYYRSSHVNFVQRPLE